jgi:hypothetical protein
MNWAQQSLPCLLKAHKQSKVCSRNQLQRCAVWCSWANIIQHSSVLDAIFRVWVQVPHSTRCMIETNLSRISSVRITYCTNMQLILRAMTVGLQYTLHCCCCFLDFYACFKFKFQPKRTKSWVRARKPLPNLTHFFFSPSASSSTTNACQK